LSIYLLFSFFRFLYYYRFGLPNLNGLPFHNISLRIDNIYIIKSVGISGHWNRYVFPSRIKFHLFHQTIIIIDTYLINRIIYSIKRNPLFSYGIKIGITAVITGNFPGNSSVVSSGASVRIIIRYRNRMTATRVAAREISSSNSY
jgi:hypothetical protein